MTRTSTTATVLNFPSHLGTQGNPHLYSNADGTVNSVWVDNEKNLDPALDLFFYELTAGTFPSGTWSSVVQLPTDKLDLPTAKESMPFFDGTTLYFGVMMGVCLVTSICRSGSLRKSKLINSYTLKIEAL